MPGLPMLSLICFLVSEGLQKAKISLNCLFLFTRRSKVQLEVDESLASLEIWGK